MWNRNDHKGSLTLHLWVNQHDVSCHSTRVLERLSNHDDDGNKNTTNLHIWQWKNSIFARIARAFFIFWHFEDILVLSTMWNDLFCSRVDNVSIWWQMFNFVFLCLKRWSQFNSRIVRRHFSSIMSLNNWKMIAEILSDDVLAFVVVVFAWAP